LERIRGKGITDNVAILIADRLARYDSASLEVLGRLACLGSDVPSTTLAQFIRVPVESVDAEIRKFIAADLVHRVPGGYAFSHDRIREAAYALIPAADRPRLHLEIGRLLASPASGRQLEENIFEIVNHYNQGIPLIDSDEERHRLAQLNLAAGERAKASTAYESALVYLSTGCALLEADGQALHSNTRFALEFHQADCKFMVGDVAFAEERLALLAERTTTLMDLALVVGRQLILYLALGRISQAFDLAIGSLARFGVILPSRATDADIENEFQLLMAKIGDRDIETLADLPRMQDPHWCAVMELLEALLGPAGVIDLNLISVAQLRMATISVEHGNCDATPHAYAGLAGRLFGWRLGSFAAGRDLGRVAMRLVDEFGYDRYAERVCAVTSAVIAPFQMPLREAYELALRVTEMSPDRGGLMYTGYAWCSCVCFLLDGGASLADVLRQGESGIAYVRKREFPVAMEMVTIPLQFARALRGLTSKFASMDDGEFNEEAYLHRLQSTPHLLHCVPRFNTRRLQLQFFAGNYAACIKIADAIGDISGFPPIYELVAEYRFFAALARTSVLSDPQQEPAAADLDAIRAEHGLLDSMAALCAVNFADRARLIAAELARIENKHADAGRLYEEAIRLARENGFVQNEAIANELAARFYSARDLAAVADAYLRNARSCYQRWGADAKVRQLEEEFPQLRDELAPPSFGKSLSGTRLRHLDVAAVIEMHHAVSREIVLDRLIERLMVTVVEHAGAVRGLLLLPQRGEMRIAAEAITGDREVVVNLRHLSALSGELPQSLLNYVTRTRSAVILDDALNDNEYSSDAYILSARPRSVLCLPLVKQKRLVGVLYLENSLSSHIFTPDRLSMLQLLASQAAISIENAKLFLEVQQAQDEARAATEELRLSFDMMPALAWRASANGSFEFANKQWHDYTGISQDDARAGTWIQAFHPDDVENVAGKWSTLLERRVAGEVEARMRRFDGEFRSFLVRVTPLHDR
ncbi:MAG: GAF domain-containing protein, partial [Acidobacteriota bacterium]